MEVVLERKTINRINESNTREILKRVAAVLKEKRHLGFLGRLSGLSEPESVLDNDGDEKYLYRAVLQLKDLQSDSPELVPARYRKAMDLLTRAAQGCGWSVVGSESGYGPPSLSTPSGFGAPPPSIKPRFVPPKLTDEVMASRFGSIFGREAHTRVIHEGVEHYFMGGKPAHFLLSGEPGAAKTKLLECFQGWYNSDGHERLLILYGTGTTKAGLQNWLLDRAEKHTLPDILALEEIEKQDKDNLDCLLSVMASGFICKTTAPLGHIRRDTPILIWATCNDIDALMNHRRGALYSRFEELPCSRPNRDETYTILLQEVASLGGDPRWADAALAFGWDERGERDPRKIVGLLKGRDRLLDGSYQEDIRAIHSRR